MFGYSNCGMVTTPEAGQISSRMSFSHVGITEGCATCHGTGQSIARFPIGHSATNAKDCGQCHGTTSWLMANPHAIGAGVPTTCISCHAAKVPSGYQGSATIVGNLTPVGGLFDHASHGGTGDCVSCHTAAPDNVGVTWAGGIYQHSPTPSTCLGCHTPAQVPVGPIGLQKFDHANGGTGDCVSCHASNVANIGRTWVVGTFTHSPVPAACALCHVNNSNYLAIQNTVKNQMNHTYKGLPDCASCHTSAATANSFSSWLAESVANRDSTPRATLGVFHTGYGSTPTTCETCHTNERPVGYKGTVGLINNLTPTGGLFDHAANGGTGECATCHTSVPSQIGLTWVKGVFSHSPTPTTCLGCHTSAQRPTGPVGSPAFDHANGGLGDCVGCHASVPANIGKTWASGNYSHSPTPTSCSSCHLSDAKFLQVQNVITNQMKHTISGLPDCALCHSLAASAGGWKSWINESVLNGDSSARTSKGIFHLGYGAAPSTCSLCHSNERPAGPVGPRSYDHANGGAGDCVSCHVSVPANIGLNWTGGSFGHTPAPTSCNTCHMNDAGYLFIKSKIVNQMNHSMSGLPDCASCHKASSSVSGWTSWQAEAIANEVSADLSAKGVFHSNYASVPATCQNCHSNERPKIIVSGFNHSTSGTGDCIGCHSSANKVGLTWSGASAIPSSVVIDPPSGSSGWPSLTVAHPNLANNPGQTCTTCHGTTPLKGSLIAYDHSAGYSLPSSVGCFYCHGTGQKVVKTTGVEIKIGPLSSGSTANLHKGGKTVTSTQTCQSCHAHSGLKLPTWDGTKFSGGGL